MAVLAADKGPAERLAVFTIDQQKPRHGRYVSWLTGAAPGQAPLLDSPRALDPTWTAFDVCRLDPASPRESLVMVHAGGVVDWGDASAAAKPLLQTSTLLAYARDDALPRMRLCFQLYPGEPPAILVPTLAGTEVWRAKTPRQYGRAQRLSVDADQRLFATPWRGGGDLAAQFVYTRIDLPDVYVADANGDQKPDVCLCREDHLRCFLQKQGGELQSDTAYEHRFHLLSAEEEMDATLKVSCRLVDLTGDGRVDVVLAKNRFNISDMGASLYVYHRNVQGGFPAKAAQTITRKGYFAYQDFFDFDGDGLVDMVAPVAALNWSDIAGIYLSRMASIDFMLYRNQGGRLQDPPKTLHSLRFPVDLKNYQAILAALPQWNARIKRLPDDRAKARQVLFFPERKAIEMYAADGPAGIARLPLWRHENDLGTELSRLDINGDGWDELLFAYPRDAKRSRELLFIEPSSR